MGVFSKMFEKPELPKRKYCFTEEEARGFKSSGIKPCELAIFKWVVFAVMSLILVFVPLFAIDIGITSVKFSIFNLLTQETDGMGMMGFLKWFMFIMGVVVLLGNIVEAIYGVAVYSNKTPEEFMQKKERWFIRNQTPKGKIRNGSCFYGSLGMANIASYLGLLLLVLASILGGLGGDPTAPQQSIHLWDINVVPIAAIIIFVVGNIAYWVINYFQKVAFKLHFAMFKQKFDESIENAEKEEEQKKLEEEQKKVLEEQKEKEEAERQAKEKAELYQKMKEELRAEIKKEQDKK